MRFGFRAAIGVGLALLGASRAASAQPRDSVVWYRASDQCPAGPEFLARLPAGTDRPRLANAGDHIDFVVTLLAAKDRTVGRLERQTKSGTVAIRELSDASCARVADALALSLGLALEPGGASEQPAPVEASEPQQEPPDFEQAPAPVAPALESQATSPGSGPVRDAIVVARENESSRWAFGIEGGALLGVTPSLMPRAIVFAELEPTGSDFALRFGFVGAYGSTSTQIANVEQWVLAGRAEVCPWQLGNPHVSFRPCAALELGDTRGSARSTESSLWAASGIGVHAGFALSRTLALELSDDVLAQLDRSEVDGAGSTLYQSKMIAFSAGVGISFRPF